jgi:16S rRNA C967 or C1407 C5-methylase (RsmB/RsmF family)
MGRRWSRKRKQQEKKSKRPKERKSWVKVTPGNAKFEAYYAIQGLHNLSLNKNGDFVECTTDKQKEEERMAWLTSLRAMLPASFRIGTDVDPVLRERLELELDSHFVDTEMEIVVQDDDDDDDKKPPSTTTTKTIAPAKHIPYIPHAYQLSVDRRTIRRNPKLQEFHEWLTTQTSCGNITRQETVSMIPPIVLSVEPHHTVLDMCAAPGSKTSQLLEIVSTCGSGDLEPRGCVVANDSDPKRGKQIIVECGSCDNESQNLTHSTFSFHSLHVGPSVATHQ